MRMYFRFLFTLACGLVGVGLVLKVLLDTLFNDWDVVYDVRRRFRSYISGQRRSELIRPEDALVGEKRDGSALGARTERLRPQTSETLASINPS